MKKQALSLAVLVAGSFPVASNALSLGDIRSNSSLNQPLRAKIELLSTSVQEAKQLQVRLAPNNVFNRVGVDRPAFLDSLRFRSVTENGKPVILITSDAPISEPFVNFLLEVSWPQGQLLKEYTVMLDPPVLMQPGTALAGTEAAVRAEPRSTGLVSRPPAPSASPTQVASVQAQQQAAQQQRQRAQRQQQAQQQAAQQQKQRVQQPPASSAGRTYRVRRGDTLFKVASRLQQPGVNVDQMMIALYRANPQAFISGNINGLKAGAVLRAPSAQAVRSSSRAQARRQVRQQYSQWKKFRSSLAQNTVPQESITKQPVKTASTNTTGNKTADKTTSKTDKARLEVLGKTDKASTAKGASASSPDLAKLEKKLALANESMVARQRENKELKSRITDLESMLRKKNRLIALRDDQLAQLQKKLAGSATTGTPANTQQNTANSTAQQPPLQNVIPRNTGDVNQTATNTQAATNKTDSNKIVRAQQPVTNQLSAAEKRAQQLADDARKAAQAKLADRQQPTDADKTAAKSPFADEQKGDNDLLSLLSSPMAWKIGAGALASLLLLWLLSRLFGRRKPSEDDRIAPVTNEHPPREDNGMDPATGDVNAEQNYAGLEAELDKAEKYNELDDDPFGTRLPQHETAQGDNNNGISEADADSVADEDEVLMEANVYIAYGLYQQAESELKKALDKHPERLEYRHKLLENYFVSNNRDEFDQHAAAFIETAGADRNSKMWREITEWGGKISPDNKLYQQHSDSDGLSPGGLAAGAAATTAVVGAGAAALLSGDAPADAERTELISVDSASEPDDLTNDDFDFDLDELENELGQLESLDDDAVHLGDSANDLIDRVEINDNPGLGNPDNAEFANTVDDDLDFSLDDLANELAGYNDPDAASDMGQDVTAEINNLAEAAEPLDFDVLLNGSELDEHSLLDMNADEPTEQDDDSGSGILGGLAAGAVAAAGAATAVVISGKDKAADKPDDAGQVVTDMFDGNNEQADTQLDEPLDFSLPELTDAEDTINAEVSSVDDDLGLDFDFDESDDAELKSVTDNMSDADDMGMDDLDFNLDELEAEVAAAEVTEQGADNDNVTNLNLHLDQDSGLRKILPQDTFYAQNEDKSADNADDEDSWLGDIDDALSFLDMPDEEIDLHEAHISTKLDLARAYLDMGDIEGARSTLEEVMVEGNDNQRREAEDLLHETG